MQLERHRFFVFFGGFAKTESKKQPAFGLLPPCNVLPRRFRVGNK